MYVGICPYRSGRRWPPLRPVAPEHAPLASRIVIELILGCLCSKCQAGFTRVSEETSETVFLLVENYLVDRFSWSSDRLGIFEKKLP